MKKELALLNLICLLIAFLLFGFAVWNAIFSPDFLSIDNLFITAVFLVLALMFISGPLLQMKSEGRLPIPFKKRLAKSQGELVPATHGGAIATGTYATAPPLLDAKGRAVPPDVRGLVGRFTPAERKE